MPKVSVVIPTFNRCGTLRRAVESVLGQTVQDLEIIVADDGSTDGTADTVASFASEGVRYVRLSGNRGGGAARNAGIGVARGEFVAFLDDDDSWEAEKLRLQLRAVGGETPGEDGRGDWCRTGVGIYSTAGRYKRYVFMALPFDDPHKSIMSDNCIGVTSSILVRRECLEAIHGFDDSLPALQDWDLYIRLIRKGCRLRGVDAPLVRYSTTYVVGSVSGSFRRLKVASILLRQKFRDDPYYPLLDRRLKIIVLKRLFKSRRFLIDAITWYITRPLFPSA